MRRMYSENQLQEQVKNQLAEGKVNNVKVFENIVDKDGHKRFVEGNGTPRTQEGLTSSYCKWSLSGTHLLLVFAGSIASGTTISNGVPLAYFGVPEWVLNKVFPVWQDYIESKAISIRASNWSTQDMTLTLAKSSQDLRFIHLGELTLTADRNFRIAFDLLIDNE